MEGTDMHRCTIFFFLIVLVLFSSCLRNESTEKATPLEVTVNTDTTITSLKKPEGISPQFSYVYGQQIAKTLKSNYPDVDLEYLARGVYDACKKESFFSEDECLDILTTFQRKVYEEADKILSERAEKNLLEAETFLLANSKRTNVKSFSDKLQYEILREGREDGRVPSKNATVAISYMLKDLSGTIKDSSYVRGEASVLKLSQTVDGFAQAVTLMREGEKIRVWLHPDLGYGSVGNSLIGPNELLIFDIELIEVIEDQK